MKNAPKPIIVYTIILSALLLVVLKVDAYVLNPEDLNLLEAIENGNLEAAQTALKNGADPNESERSTPARQKFLMIVAGEGKLDLAKLLVKYGADVNAVDVDGNTALMNAASFGNLDIVKFLVEHGANVNAAATVAGFTGYTALIYASERGQVNVVKYLIKHGANINAKKKNGDTALSLAVNNGHTEIARILREAGAK
jgi:ankyrin repeat protein